jgi:NitT/TauT family transport system substrate-binding protein
MRCWSGAIAGRVLSIVLASWFLPGDCSMAAQPNKVRISYSSRSNSNTPFIIALNKGFFVEEGMDVELIQVNPRLGATAVLNGDLDFTTTFGTTLRGIIGGFPIKFVAVAVKKSEHFLLVRPEIKEIRDLSGKKLGVATLFGSDQRAAEEMIRGKGFAPNLMKPMALGESPVRAQALRAGLVDAISISSPFDLSLKSEGFRVWRARKTFRLRCPHRVWRWPIACCSRTRSSSNERCAP